MMQQLKTLLSHRGFVPGVMVLSTLLMAGTLNNGFLLDDYLHQIMMRDDPGADGGLHWVKAAPWDLFKLIPDEPEFVRHSVESGINPWWGAKSYQATFFRPLSSLSMYLDHLLWPHAPMMMHVHSLLWSVLMCVMAYRVFLRVLPTPFLAALALGFFALDDAHVFPAGWIANRNGLIATTLSLTAFLMHLRWRMDQWRFGAVAAPLMLALALLAGEFALGIVGFIFAHVIFMEDGTWRQKLLRLAPYGAVVVMWRVVYNLLGYGVWGSDLYVDPLGSPWAFFEVMVQRLP
ncbi:MAG: hypothetical protein JXX14_19460, partial [Deltaproteobacteria bacterium]|nr:hypothetical protein [Deltaproteobacteria bacterium]